MRKSFPSPYHFRGVTKMVSNPLSSRTSATVANFAIVQKAGGRNGAPQHPKANRRPQLLQILQQLPFGQSDRDQLLQNLHQLSARALAEQEYESYRRSLDTQPSPVEVHFDEAVKKAKQLAQPKKTPGKKSEGGE